jgi:hypothetical protein
MDLRAEAEWKACKPLTTNDQNDLSHFTQLLVLHKGKGIRSQARWVELWVLRSFLGQPTLEEITLFFPSGPAGNPGQKGIII